MKPNNGNQARAIRGGSWYYRAQVSRGVDLDGTYQDEDYGYLGFRLVHDSDDGAGRVVRGGGWNGSAQVARVADRLRVDPAYRPGILGFRLARDTE